MAQLQAALALSKAVSYPGITMAMHVLTMYYVLPIAVLYAVSSFCT
jgi:hypothetical protein